MSDKPYFHEPNDTIHLRVWALGQMVWGAFLGGAVPGRHRAVRLA